MSKVSRLGVTWRAVACSLILTGSAPALCRAVEPIQFDIAPQPLSAALKSFAMQSKMQILYRQDVVAGATGNAVVGSFDRHDALRQLIEGTGLEIVFSADNAATIRVKSAGLQGGRLNGSDIHLAQGDEAGGAERAQSRGTSDASAGSTDDESARLEEVVVTAQKREQSLSEVPMSISAVSGEELDRRNMLNLQSLSYTVPGLNVFDQGAGRQDVSIRGIQSKRGTSALTGIYLDEMPLSGMQDGFTAMYTNVQAVDLERIEVLKGPQGTLFGEGAVGGVIRYVTRNPDLNEFGGDMKLTLSDMSGGSFGKQFNGVLNAPIVRDALGLRIAGVVQDNGGWIENVVGGKENYNGNRLWNVRSKLLWQPTDALSITGMVDVHRDDGDGSNVITQNGKFFYPLDPNASTAFQDEYELYNLTVKYDLGFADLLSATSHLSADSSASYFQYNLGEDPPPVPNAIGPLFALAMPVYHFVDDMVVQELRLASPAASRLKWVAGASYKKAQRDQDFGPQGYGGVVIYEFLIEGGEAGAIYTNESESWAAFGDVSYPIGERLELGGGLRHYTDRRKTFDTLGRNQSGTFDKMTYRAFMRFMAARGLNFYANVANGFRSGGINPPQAVLNGAPLKIGEENSIFYELGMKSVLQGGRIAFDLALYQGEYGDQQQDVQTTNAEGNFLQYTANAGTAEIRGVEWLLKLAPAAGLTFSLSGNVIDTEFTEVNSLSAPPVFVGDKLSFVPEYTLQASGDYEFQWTGAIAGNVNINYARVGKAYSIIRGYPLGPEVGISTPLNFLEASVGAQWNDFEFMIFGKNLLDERRPLNPENNGNFTQARPRTVGIAISKSF